MWWTSILTLGFAIAGRLHRHGLIRQEEGELGEGLVRAQVMLGENLLERIEVGAGDQAPAAFASVAVGRADRVAAGADDRAQAGAAAQVDAHVFLELALDTYGLVRDLRGTALQQGLHSPNELMTVDGTAGEEGINGDDGFDGAGRVGVIPIGLVPVDGLPDVGKLMAVAGRVDPAEIRTRSQRHDELGLLADFLEGRFVTRARAGALDKGDGIALSFFTHRLPEANDLDGLEQLGGGLERVDYRELAAFAACELEEGDLRPGH